MIARSAAAVGFHKFFVQSGSNLHLEDTLLRRMADGSPLTIAGLWDEWKDIETRQPLMSCTMLITNANDLASKIHDRMPVLLQPGDFDRWLAGNAGSELLKPAANDYLQTWPVSRRVNSSRAPGDDPTLMSKLRDVRLFKRRTRGVFEPNVIQSSRLECVGAPNCCWCHGFGCS